MILGANMEWRNCTVLVAGGASFRAGSNVAKEADAMLLRRRK
jgi:hypothetical protein